MCSLVGIVSEKPNFGLLYSVPQGYVELPDLFKKRRLNMNEKLSILLQVSKAITHCHSMGRTISWMSYSNVLVSSQVQNTNLGESNYHRFMRLPFKANLSTNANCTFAHKGRTLLGRGIAGTPQKFGIAIKTSWPLISSLSGC